MLTAIGGQRHGKSDTIGSGCGSCQRNGGGNGKVLAKVIA